MNFGDAGRAEGCKALLLLVCLDSLLGRGPVGLPALLPDTGTIGGVGPAETAASAALLSDFAAAVSAAFIGCSAVNDDDAAVGGVGRSRAVDIV